MGLHLIVDDVEVRHTEFSRILRGHQLDHAYTVNEAIMFMRKRYFGFDRSFKEDLDRVDNYDVIFLDHDIDAGYDRRNVLQFVKWIADNDSLLELLRKHGTKFFIHSHNPDGAENMRSILAQLGFEVIVKPFA